MFCVTFLIIKIQCSLRSILWHSVNNYNTKKIVVVSTYKYQLSYFIHNTENVEKNSHHRMSIFTLQNHKDIHQIQTLSKYHSEISETCAGLAVQGVELGALLLTCSQGCFLQIFSSRNHTNIRLSQIHAKSRNAIAEIKKMIYLKKNYKAINILF